MHDDDLLVGPVHLDPKLESDKYINNVWPFR